MEVLVRRPELAHTVLAQERRDVSIVGDVARRPSRRNHVAQMSTMARTLAEQRDRGSVEEPVDFLEGRRERRRGLEYPRMGDGAQEFVNARPRDRPRAQSLGQLFKEALRLGVMDGFGATCVDEKVRVDRDHFLMPSIRSKSESRSSRSTPGISSPFSVVHFSL